MLLGNNSNKSTEGTRLLNIFDVDFNKHTSSKNYQEIKNLLQDLFDSSDYWEQLLSTHPLPLKRIRNLAAYSQQRGEIEWNLLEEAISDLKNLYGEHFESFNRKKEVGRELSLSNW